MQQIVLFLLLLVGSGSAAVAQTSTDPRPPEAFGYRRLVVMFRRDSVQVLLPSKPGEETWKKPLLLWEQGSLPTPLVLYDERGAYAVFPFHPKKVLESCHLAIISKPGLPLTFDVTGQNPNAIGQRQLPPYYSSTITCGAMRPCCASSKSSRGWKPVAWLSAGTRRARPWWRTWPPCRAW